MSIKISDARKALEKIAAHYDLDLKEVQELVKDEVPKRTVFASKAAREYAKEHKVKGKSVTGTGKDGKVTLDDVRAHLGEPRKKKEENLFASPAGKLLAEEHGLSQGDFSDSEKSGKPRKSGNITITINDVRRKAGLPTKEKKKSPWGSKITEMYAQEHNIDPSQIKGTGKEGKILKVDIEKFLQEQQ